MMLNVLELKITYFIFDLAITFIIHFYWNKTFILNIVNLSSEITIIYYVL